MGGNIFFVCVLTVLRGLFPARKQINMFWMICIDLIRLILFCVKLRCFGSCRVGLKHDWQDFGGKSAMFAKHTFLTIYMMIQKLSVPFYLQ